MFLRFLFLSTRFYAFNVFNYYLNVFLGDRLYNGCMLSERCLSCPVLSVLSVLSVTFVHCGQAVERIKMKLGTQVGLGPGHIVLDGTQLPLPTGQSPTQFLAHICCGHMAAWIKMPLGMELGLSPGDFVLDGDPALPSPKRGQSPAPQFSAHFCCGQRLHASRCHLLWR